MTRTVVVIPALDEAETIGAVVGAIPRDWADEVVVVDNGSQDATAAAASAAGARVVHEPRRGYGRACWSGALAAGPEAEVVVFLDGDGSDDPADLPSVVGPVLDGRADMVLGARRCAPGALPPHQVFGNRLTCRMLRLLYGVRLSDVGPFRAVRGSLLRGLDLREMTFGWPVEMVAKAARAGARVVEVSVGREPRRAGRSKVGGTLRGTLGAGYRFLAVLVRCRLGLG